MENGERSKPKCRRIGLAGAGAGDAGGVGAAAVFAALAGLKEREASLEHAFFLLQKAYTRAECEAATAACRKHMDRWPEDLGRDIGHGFHYTMQALEQREAESKRLCLTPEQHAERERLFSSVRQSTGGIDQLGDLGAVGKYEAAQEMLRAWLERFPGDRHAISRIASLQQDIDFTQSMQELMANPTDEGGLAAAD